MVKSLTEKENRGENMAIPKYQYIKDELKNKIISGQFASGDKFYTEAELIAMYDVSSITVVLRLKRPCQRTAILSANKERVHSFHAHANTNS